jgi:hypothetical protein
MSSLYEEGPCVKLSVVGIALDAQPARRRGRGDPAPDHGHGRLPVLHGLDNLRTVGDAALLGLVHAGGAGERRVARARGLPFPLRDRNRRQGRSPSWSVRNTPRTASAEPIGSSAIVGHAIPAPACAGTEFGRTAEQHRTGSPTCSRPSRSNLILHDRRIAGRIETNLRLSLRVRASVGATRGASLRTSGRCRCRE